MVSGETNTERYHLDFFHLHFSGLVSHQLRKRIITLEDRRFCYNMSRKAPETKYNLNEKTLGNISSTLGQS